MLTVAAFVVLLGVLITVHEAGHFFVAKACGVRVLTFSIGFGPRLIGFTRGETEYRIAVLPLGGYVRMYGDDVTEDIPPEEQGRAFLYQPFWKKSLIALAGPVANFVLPVVLFFALAVGHESVPAAVVGTVFPGSPAAQAGLAPGDHVLAVDGKPVEVFSDLQGIVGPRAGAPLRFDVERGQRRLELEVTPKAAPDPTIFDRKRTVGRIGVMSAVEQPVVVVAPGSPAADAGIKAHDDVVSVDGSPTRSKAELMASLDAAAGKGSATLVVRTPAPHDDKKPAPEKTRTVELSAAPAPAAPIALARFGVTSDELSAQPLAGVVDATREATATVRAETARRFGLSSVDGLVEHVEDGTVAAEMRLVAGKDRIVAVDGKALRTNDDLRSSLEASPDAIHVVGVLGGEHPRVIAFRMLAAPQREMGGLKVFGVALTDAIGNAAMVERTVSPPEAAKRAVVQTVDVIGDVVRGLGLLVTGTVGIGGISGPGGIAKMAGEAARQGAAPYIDVMALISANLGVLNLLPIPVLDGGHLLFFVVELFTRKRVSVETRKKATLIGLGLIGILMLIAITNDVIGFFH